jgi:hypothetical protein
MQAQAQYEGQNVLTPQQWQRAQDWAYKGMKPVSDTASPAPVSKALGGFVGSKMLSWLGERGPEAVIPLNRSERSLGLLERTAGALGARMSGQAGHSVSINYNPTIHAGSADAGNLRAMLSEHVEHLVSEIKRTLSIETERMAAI